MDEINDISSVEGEKSVANNSLGMLALEYDSTTSDDDDTNEMKSKDAECIQLSDEESMVTVPNPSKSNSTLGSGSDSMQSSPSTNTVDLFSYVAELSNAKLPMSTAEIVNRSKQPISTNGIEKSQEVEILVEKEPINLMEYVANLQKVQLPISNTMATDTLSFANLSKGQSKSNKESERMDYRTQCQTVVLSSSEDSEEDSDDTVDSSSDSSESSSSSSSSEDEKDDGDEKNDKMEDENSKEDKQNTCKRGKNIEKSEFDNLPPIEDLKISVPEVLCDPVGEVAWFVEQMVVVRPKPEKPTLNLDTVLFLEKGSRVLGQVFDVFGTVQEPHYCVRFNSEEHIKENNIKVGMTVYYCPNSPHTTLVFLSDLTKMKATDANDYSEHPEFSDDEEEQSYYANLRKNKTSQKAGQKTNTSNEPTNKKRKPNERQVSWHNRFNNWSTPNQASNAYSNAMQQPQFVAPQEQPYMTQPQTQMMPPMMQPYPMPNAYMPNASYTFGYQNWPPARMPYYNLYTQPPPPPPPFAPGSQIRRPRYPMQNPNSAPRPRARFPASQEVRYPGQSPEQ